MLTLFGLQIDVIVGVYDHHHGTNQSTGLEDEYEGAVEEETNAKEELDRVAHRPNVVDVIVQLLPHR